MTRNHNQEANPHEYLQELCALLPSGELSKKETSIVARHLVECADCRGRVGSYAAVLGAFASSADSHPLENSPLRLESWRLNRARSAIFDKLEEKPESARAVLSLKLALLTLMVVSAALIGYQVGHSAKIRSAPLPEAAVPTASDARGTERLKAALEQAQTETERAQVNSNELTKALGARTLELESLKSLAGDRGKLELRVKILENQMEASSAENQALKAKNQQLETSSASLQTVLAQQQGRISAADDRINHLQAELIQANVKAKEAESQMASQQQYLSSDRDIRELMGARDLYMADVMDVDRNGKARQAQGRIFYTKGRSLIFYAFDLDKQPHTQNATFQVWGLSGLKTHSVPINMGVFYLDSEAHKRWIMKFNDPKELARIDSVFVTVEPAGGSQKPSGPQLMFASLQNQPNHP